MLKINYDDIPPGIKHFTYGEMLYLPRWSRFGNEKDDGLNEITLKRLLFLASKLDAVREELNAHIFVTVWWRPIKYNQLIGGAGSSTHMASVDHSGHPLVESDMTAAVDFVVDNYTGSAGCDLVRQKILKAGLLQKLGLRMENKLGSNWVHLDTGQVITNRFFIP